MPLVTRRRLPAWALAVALGAGLATGGLPAGPRTTGGSVALAAATPTKPNIVLILMDDFSTELLATMANGMRMKSQGASFTNSFVADSLCCVSRSALLTGQYPHLNGVYTNNPNSSTNPQGGWRAFKQNGDMAT